MTDLSQMTDAQIMAGLAQTTDPDVMAIHSNESGGASNARADIVNPVSGARGSMQTMPKTAGDPGFGVKPSDGTPQDDARLGTEYYQALRKKYNDPTIAAVAYNWGPGKTDSWLANGADMSKIPNETLKYALNFNAKSSKAIPPAPQADSVPTAATLAPGEADVTGQDAPAAPIQPPMSLGNQLMRQLGLTARAVGHGVADAAGVIGNPLNTAINAAGSVVGANPNLNTSLDTTLRDFVDQNTPTPANALERGVGDVASAVANPINAAMMGVPATGLTRAALMGAAGGANQPLHADSDLGQYAGQIAAGGAGGVALGALGKVVGGAKLSPNAQSLVDQGVTITPGQALGGAARTMEEKLGSVPVLGEAVASAERGAIKQMNKAAYSQVLEPIGGTVPKNVGRDAIDDISDQISAKYNNLLPQVTFKTDAPFMQDMQGIAQTVSSLPSDLQKRFTSTIDRNFLSQIQGGQMDGATLKKVESIFGQEASNFSSSADPFQRDLGGAFKDTQTAIRQALLRGNPQQAPELQAINKAFSNYAILRNAAARVNDPAKPIMPGQLQAAVKSQDKTVAKGAFAKGNARMQGLSDPAMDVLGSKYPDSGTAGRIAYGTLLGGGAGSGLINPAFAVTSLLGPAMYGTAAGRKAMLALIAQRPDLMRGLGSALGGLAPVTGAAAAKSQ